MVTSSFCPMAGREMQKHRQRSAHAADQRSSRLASLSAGRSLLLFEVRSAGVSKPQCRRTLAAWWSGPCPAWCSTARHPQRPACGCSCGHPTLPVTGLIYKAGSFDCYLTTCETDTGAWDLAEHRKAQAAYHKAFLGAEGAGVFREAELLALGALQLSWLLTPARPPTEQAVPLCSS